VQHGPLRRCHNRRQAAPIKMKRFRSTPCAMAPLAGGIIRLEGYRTSRREKTRAGPQRRGPRLSSRRVEPSSFLAAAAASQDDIAPRSASRRKNPAPGDQDRAGFWRSLSPTGIRRICPHDDAGGRWLTRRYPIKEKSGRSRSLVPLVLVLNAYRTMPL
jgi:hypothetical protein